MFCRFGSLLLSRPVAATAWLNVVCTRPVAGFTSAGSASTYVPLSFWMLRHLSTSAGSSCVSASSSSTSCAVETTRVLPVFFAGLQVQLREQHVAQLLRRVDVELAAGVPVDARREIVELGLHRVRRARPARPCRSSRPRARWPRARESAVLEIAVDRVEAVLRRGRSSRPGASDSGRSARSPANVASESRRHRVDRVALMPLPVSASSPAAR